jgi:hypothetical protein
VNDMWCGVQFTGTLGQICTTGQCDLIFLRYFTGLVKNIRIKKHAIDAASILIQLQRKKLPACIES